MENKIKELNEYEKLIDALGREIAALYEICGAIREIEQQSNDHTETFQQFGTFFYMFYRLCYYEIYHGISRLTDQTKGVISIIKLLKTKEENKPCASAELTNIEKELVDMIKNNISVKKIKNYRDNKLGHKNKQLILDISLENEFKENNKLHLDDIEALLHLLGKAIQRASERASFHILTLPETHIRMDIANLFDSLCKQPHEV